MSYRTISISLTLPDFVAQPRRGGMFEKSSPAPSGTTYQPGYAAPPGLRRLLRANIYIHTAPPGLAHKIRQDQQFLDKEKEPS
jgi:hypothetical protein